MACCDTNVSSATMGSLRDRCTALGKSQKDFEQKEK